jgi:hypothetical protein
MSRKGISTADNRKYNDYLGMTLGASSTSPARQAVSVPDEGIVEATAGNVNRK